MTAVEGWAGVFPAVLTMFDRSGRLDLPATAAHVDDLVREGADGIVVGGTSGEFIALSERERKRLTETAVDAVAGRVPVIAGTGCYSTAATVKLSRHAAQAGADGVIVILPYYQRPSPAEVVAHLAAVAARTSLPVMAYNNPTNSAASPLSAGDLAGLYHDAGVRAVKSTFPTVHQIHEARAATDDGFRVFYGSFMAPLEGLAGGAHGWISGILNVAIAPARELIRAVSAGDLSTARRVWHEEILPIKRLYTERLLGEASDLVIYRAILDQRGLHGGHSRLPLRALSSEQRRRLAELLPT